MRMSRARSFRRVLYRGTGADQGEAAQPPRVSMRCGPHRTDRFRHALENARLASCVSLWRRHSQVLLELHGRSVAKRRVESFLVVQPLEEMLDRGPRLRQIAVFLPMHLFVFERLHERLAG